MTRIITDAQAKYAHEHSQLVSGPEMRRELSNEWDAYIAHVRAEAWEAGCEAGVRNADHRLRLALDILDGRFQPTDRIGDLHGAMKRALRGDL